MIQEFAHVLGSSRWLMEPKAFRAMVKRAETATPDAVQAAVQAYMDRQSAGPRLVGDVAVIEACGPITYKRSWFSMYFGSATIESMQAQFRTALADAAVKTIVFRWDSPGGLVDMVPEFADEVFAARGQKPILSVADTMIASAALWIAAQADLIYASASAQVGSVGAYLLHEDISGMLEQLGVKLTFITHGEHKVDGNPYEPLTPEVEADLQKEIDEIGGWFDTAMARARGVTKQVVLDTFGQGKVFSGKKAIAIGLADKAGTFSQVIGKLTKGKASSTSSASAAAASTSTFVHDLLTERVQAQSDTVEPDDDGSCPEGYEKGDDGQCHKMDDGEAAAAAQADEDLATIDRALD